MGAAGSFADQIPCMLLGCHQPAPKVCSRCGWAHYCSAAHQKQHWRVHKKICAPESSMDQVRRLVGAGLLREWLRGMLTCDALCRSPLCCTCPARTPLTAPRCRSRRVSDGCGAAGAGPGAHRYGQLGAEVQGARGRARGDVRGIVELRVGPGVSAGFE